MPCGEWAPVPGPWAQGGGVARLVAMETGWRWSRGLAAGV